MKSTISKALGAFIDFNTVPRQESEDIVVDFDTKLTSQQVAQEAAKGGTWFPTSNTEKLKQ